LRRGDRREDEVLIPSLVLLKRLLTVFQGLLQAPVVGEWLLLNFLRQLRKRIRI
jgi:hypothetical protein